VGPTLEIHNEVGPVIVEFDIWVRATSSMELLKVMVKVLDDGEIGR